MNQVPSIPSAGPREGLSCTEYAQIDAPGAYVVRESGILVRVPPDGLIAGRSPAVTLCGRDGVAVCRISDDPWIPLNRARSIAANNDLMVKF